MNQNGFKKLLHCRIFFSYMESEFKITYGYMCMYILISIYVHTIICVPEIARGV